MRPVHEWPGTWTRVAPRVEDHPSHPAGAELAWLARGYPFNRPVLARTNVGARKVATPGAVAAGPNIASVYERFVRVELMADGFHGLQASDFGWYRDLEWLGPLAVPAEAAEATEGAVRPVEPAR